MRRVLLPVLALALAPGACGPPPPPAAPVPPRTASGSGPPRPGRAAPPYDGRVFRSHDEVLVFVRHPLDGTPAASCPVAVLDAAGQSLRSGHADETGVFRARIGGGGARSLRLGTVQRGATLPLPDAPPARVPSAPVLADRSVARPGDAVRVAVLDPGRTRGDARPALRIGVRVEPADPAFPARLLDAIPAPDAVDPWPRRAVLSTDPQTLSPRGTRRD